MAITFKFVTSWFLCNNIYLIKVIKHNSSVWQGRILKATKNSIMVVNANLILSQPVVHPKPLDWPRLKLQQDLLETIPSCVALQFLPKVKPVVYGGGNR